MVFDDFREHPLHVQQPFIVETGALRVAVRVTPLRAVQTGDRHAGHAEERIDAVDAAPGYDRHPPRA